MIPAIKNNMLKFETKEDTLTSSFFGLLFYMSDSFITIFLDIKQLIFVERKSVFLYNDGIVSAVLYEDNSEIYFRYYIKSNDESNVE